VLPGVSRGEPDPSRRQSPSVEGGTRERNQYDHHRHPRLSDRARARLGPADRRLRGRGLPPRRRGRLRRRHRAHQRRRQLRPRAGRSGPDRRPSRPGSCDQGPRRRPFRAGGSLRRRREGPGRCLESGDYGRCTTTEGTRATTCSPPRKSGKPSTTPCRRRGPRGPRTSRRTLDPMPAEDPRPRRASSCRTEQMRPTQAACQATWVGLAVLDLMGMRNGRAGYIPGAQRTADPNRGEQRGTREAATAYAAASA
jgi:hypothetical protein